MEIKIYNKDDRLKVAQILIDNGYTVRQIKKKKTENSKSVEYYLVVTEEDNNVDTAR